VVLASTSWLLDSGSWLLSSYSLYSSKSRQLTQKLHRQRLGACRIYSRVL